MHEQEAVDTGPGNGDMSLLQGAAHEIHVSQHPTQEIPEGTSRTIQRILVVEDDPTLATLESEILTAHGYIVVTVHSGELAITALRSAIPDLVVLDLELPGSIKGWEVLQMLRTTASIPVLVTTSATTAVRQHIRSRGESRITLDHLPKPYPMQALLKRVKRMLMIAPQ
jgi:DNA-binding response OmpR family regulator